MLAFAGVFGGVTFLTVAKEVYQNCCVGGGVCREVYEGKEVVSVGKAVVSVEKEVVYVEKEHRENE